MRSPKLTIFKLFLCAVFIGCSALMLRLLLVKNPSDSEFTDPIAADFKKILPNRLTAADKKDTEVSKASITKEEQSKKVEVPTDPQKPDKHPIQTIPELFGQRANTVEDPSSVSIFATGDIMLSRAVNIESVKRNDYKWMFENTKDELSKADLTIVNLETPIKSGCKPFNQGMIFCADEQNIQSLNYAGIDLASVGNNHAMDQGPSGLLNTVKLLTENNITPVGHQNPQYKTVKGIKFAFLAYTELSCNSQFIGCLNETKIANEIAEAKKNADYVIPFFHWGTEYTTKITTNQKKFAKLAIDNGADLVLGSHPHWVQGIDFYKNKMIVYSMGNFVFDQMWSTETKKGLTLRLVFDKGSKGVVLTKVDFKPVLIEEYGRPKFVVGQEKASAIGALQALSIPQTQ